MKVAMTLAASLAYSALVLGEEGYLADEIEPGNHFFAADQLGMAILGFDELPSLSRPTVEK
jgi:hypothetical protein